MNQTLAVLVENKAGVLTRITNLFSRRGYNIISLAVGMTQSEDVSRITLTTSVEPTQMPQILKLLYNMPDVISAKALAPDDYVSRQLIFIKVRATAESRGDIQQIVSIFRGHVVDLSPSTMTIEISGNDSKLAALKTLLEPYGILELVRTGIIAIERADAQLYFEAAPAAPSIQSTIERGVPDETNL